jgi:DNA-binding LytR/AlgR family response regulator
MVDEHRFFRINRKYILSNLSIADIVFYSNSRLKIKLKKPDEENIIVSRDKVAAFKEWLDL